jgi:hypothetical protein
MHSMHPSIYGSLATRAFSWLFFPGRELWINVLAWKGLVAGLLGLTALLLWDCGRALGRCSRERLALLVMFAWSPSVLSEGPLRGHVDAMVAFLLALGLRQFLRNQETIGLAILASAISVKLSLFLLWPAILARAIFGAPTPRQGIVRSILVACSAALFYAVWFLPSPTFGSPIPALDMVRLWTSNSLAHVLTGLVRDAGGPSGLVTKAMTGAMFVVFAFGLPAVRDRSAFLRRLARDYLLYLTIFGQLFYEWYVLPALVLVSVSDSIRLRTAALWLGAASLILLPAGRLLDAGGPAYESLKLLFMLLPAAVLVLLPDRKTSTWTAA